MAKKKTSSTSSSARRPRKPRATPASGSDRPEAVPGYTFDQARADRVADFVERFCVMSKGEWAGAPMKLLPWQRREIIEPIFGWVDSQGRRRYRQAAIFTPKKQGKSTLLSALALYLTVADGEPGAEVISAACDRQQAGIIAREAASMVRASPQLSRVLEVIDSRNTILHKASGSRYTVISADSFRAEGLNASAVLLDEAHSQRDTRLYDSLRYAGAARRSPLMISISTAGFSRGPADLWWQLWQQCESVAADPSFDPAFFGRIWKASDDPAKWFDRDEWYRANPSLGHTVSEESFAADALEARKNPSRLSAWARYRINVPTETDSRWFSHEALGACVADPPEPLEGRACLAGLDLASTLDMTAAAFCYTAADGSHDIDVIYWVPADTIAEREAKTRIPYTRWVREGWLRAVDGARLDHDRVAADIIAYAESHNIKRIGADPWNLGGIASRLQQGGIEVHAISQSIGSLTGPSKFLEGLVASRKIRWRSPILTWNLGNVQITEDANGNIRPDRARSSEKIDGAMAAIMSLALTMTDDDAAADSWDLTVI
jgi:phage terminase large subunit-like protein